MQVTGIVISHHAAGWGHLQNEKSRRVRTPFGIEHVGLFSDEPPGRAGLLFI